MVSDIMDGYSAKLVVAVAAVSAALFLLFLLSRMLRNRGPSAPRRTRSGNRPRLSVLDSTAVDANRRLVLVRRDDVEHLILVGGPSDVVIESRIETVSEAALLPGASAPLPDQRPSPAAQPTARRHDKATETIVSAPTPPAKEPGAPEIEVRRPIVRSLRSEPVEPAPANRIPAEETVTQPTQARTAPARDDTRRNIEEVLDDARGRVFGPARSAPVSEADAIPPSHQEAAAERPAPRFEDVLDAEIAGDLSAVTPGTAGRAAASDPRVAPVPEGSRAGPALDSDMARLLGELSVKR